MAFLLLLNVWFSKINLFFLLFAQLFIVIHVRACSGYTQPYIAQQEDHVLTSSWVFCCRAATCLSLFVYIQYSMLLSKLALFVAYHRSMIEIRRAVGQAHTAFTRFLFFPLLGGPIYDRFLVMWVNSSLVVFINIFTAAKVLSLYLSSLHIKKYIKSYRSNARIFFILLCSALFKKIIRLVFFNFDDCPPR